MSLETITIVVFDDDRVRRRRLSEIFRSMPLVGRVRVVASRAELHGLAELGDRSDFLVLGRERNASALDIMRSMTELGKAHPPVVVTLTAAEFGTPYVAQCYEAGAVAFIAEPLSVAGVAEVFATLQQSPEMRTPAQRSETATARIGLRFATKLLEERVAGEISGRKPMFRLLKEWASLRNWFRSRAKQETPTEEYVNALEAELRSAKPLPVRDHAATRSTKAKEHPSIQVTRLMTAKNLSVERFRGLMNLDPGLLDDFMTAKVAITPELAAALSRVVGNDPRYWLKY